MNILIARVVLLVVALLVWSYGYRYNDDTVRLAGIAIMVVAMLLRFVGPRPTRRGPTE